MTRSTRKRTGKTEEPELTIYMEVKAGPETFEAWTEGQTVTITAVDLYAAAEEDARRFARAWSELAKV